MNESHTQQTEHTSSDPWSWRTETPGANGWPRTARVDDPQKYFMVSADCHANEPSDLWHERIDKAYIERLPRIEKKPDGTTVQVSDGFRPVRIGHIVFEGEDQERNRAGRTPEERLRDHARDGIDAEIIFPNKGLSMWATSDPLFADAMCRAWNDWAWDTFGPYKEQLAPLGCIATANIEVAISEIQRVAKLGFRGLTLPCKPMWGPPDHEQSNYNLPEYDPLWAAIQDVDLPITFHIATGRDPRTSRGNGGAVINYAVHALPQAIEPVANSVFFWSARTFSEIMLRDDRSRDWLAAVDARRHG